jgi:hypothetical protein
MKAGHTAAIVIWLVVLVLAIFGGSNRPNTQFPAVVAILPLVFFTAAAFFMKSYPFDVVPLRVWIDGRFGNGSYAEFIRQLKPMLLFSVSAVVVAAGGFLRALQFTSPREAFWAQSFMFSGGIAFLLMRAILARRGLSMESRSTSKPWARSEFLPQSIRTLRATKTSAFITGGWTAIGMSTSGNLLSSQTLDPDTRSGLWLAAAVVFFFIPVFLFVFGIQHPETHEANIFSRAGLRAALRLQGIMLVRGLYWILGALIISIFFRLVLLIVS